MGKSTASPCNLKRINELEVGNKGCTLKDKAKGFFHIIDEWSLKTSFFFTIVSSKVPKSILFSIDTDIEYAFLAEYLRTHFDEVLFCPQVTEKSTDQRGFHAVLFTRADSHGLTHMRQ